MKKILKRGLAGVTAAVIAIGTMPVLAMSDIAQNEEWHKYSEVLLEDDFEKDFTWSVNITGNSPSNIKYTGETESTWRGCSSKKIFGFSTGNVDPYGEDEKMLKVNLPYDSTEGAIQKSFWFDNYNKKFNDERSGKTVIEQSLYFDSEKSFLNGHRTEDYFMCQLNYTNDEGKSTSFISYVIRPDGVTSGSLGATPSGNGAVTIPRDEWIKMVTILDYDNNKWYVYLVDKTGNATNVTSGNYRYEDYPKPIEYARYTYCDMVGEGKSSYVGIGYVKAYKYCDEDEYWKKNTNMYWQEEFDGKTYQSGKVGSARYYLDANGANYIQYMSNNPTAKVVKDPTDASNEVLEITATHPASGNTYYWHAQANFMPSDEDLTKKHIYEQKYYLTDNAFDETSSIMWQVFDISGGSKIAFVAWENGFNASNTDSTIAEEYKYTLPKNEWFTLRAELDYTVGKIDFYVVKANGVKNYVYSHTMTNALKKGLGKVRATYITTPKEGETAVVYIDDIYYYTRNLEGFELPSGYMGSSGRGVAEIGKTIEVVPSFKDGTAPYNYKVQWYRAKAGVYNYLENTLKEIPGATNASYTVTEADNGCYLFAKLIADGDSIMEGVGDIELDIYPENAKEEWGVNVGEGLWKKPRGIFFQETFDDKAYEWKNDVNSGTKIFKDNDGNEILRYNSTGVYAETVTAPEKDGKVLKLTAKYTDANKTKAIWFDHNHFMKNDGLNSLYVYEQDMYLDDKALENDGYIMLQFMYSTSGNIFGVFRKNGFNVSVSDTTPLCAVKLPKNEWFKLVTALDYENLEYTISIIRANGDEEDIITTAIPNSAFGTNGTVRVRCTYQESVNESFNNASVYFDNISYYSTDEKLPDKTLGLEHNPYLIENENDLFAFRDAVNKNLSKLNNNSEKVSKLCAKLMSDIELTETWPGIGYMDNGIAYAYGGIFDGNGYTIKGLSGEALIKEGGEGLTIKNLTINGEIKKSDITSAAAFVGTSNAAVSFTNCVNYADVSGMSNVGGFIGDSGVYEHSFERCANYGNIIGNTEKTAGFATRGRYINCIGYGAVENNNGSAFMISDKTVSESINSYYRNDIGSINDLNTGIGMTTAEFENGKVTYSMNVGAKKVIAGQNLNNDKYPVFGGTDMVYYNAENKCFSNDNGVFLAGDEESVVIASTVDAECYIAQYSDDTLVSIKTLNAENKIKEYTIIPEPDTTKARVFVWNSDFKPLSDCIEIDLSDAVDFVVDVEAGRDAVVLQLTDVQIIDAAQRRTPDRMSGESLIYWDTDKIEERCFDYIKETVEATNPDLILLTGDMIYGEFDDSGRAFEKVVKYMDSLGIPWAPIMGNHETESKIGADRQCEMLENAKNCLFYQRTLTGNGNYTVGIRQGGEIKRVFFMLDSNGSKNMSSETYANGHTPAGYGFGSDQINWYTAVAGRIMKHSPDTKLTFALHAPMQIFVDALAQYGYASDNIHIDIDNHEMKKDGDYGYIAQKISGWDSDKTVYNGIKALGVDSMLAGHYHCINASVEYDGIRFHFGNKTGTYDQINYKKDDGSIVQSYTDKGFPMVGGSVIVVSENDGSLKDTYHYYCKNEY